MQHMQRPTCTNVRIRSTADAHKIFYAVQQGILQMVTRRLDADERLALRSGCVYAWEERGPHTEITGLGIERFTEGRRWSPSRVRDEFLFYYEKFAPSPELNQNASDKVPPRDWDPLVKQTYSVWVETQKGRRKWHLTAYFTQATVDQLGTIDDIESVGDLLVPDGIFKSTRVGKTRKIDDQSNRASDNVRSSPNRTYAPFPSTQAPPHSPRSPGSQSLHMYEPYPNSNYSSGYYVPNSPHYSVPPPPPPQPNGVVTRGPYPGYETSQHPAQPMLYDFGARHSSLSGRTYGNSGASQADDFHRSPTSPFSDSPYLSSSHGSPHIAHSLQSPYPISQSPTLHRPPPVRTPATYTQAPPNSETAPTRHDTQSPDTYRSPYTSPSTPFPSSSYAYPETHAAYANHELHPSHSSTSTTSSPPRSPPQQVMLPTLPPMAVPEHTAADYSPQGKSPAASADSDDSDDERRRVGLAPLQALQRTHAYRRDPLDDRTLRLLGPRSSS